MEHNLDYFKALWHTRSLSPVSHSPEIWDERAAEWIDDLSPDGEGKRGMRERVEFTVNYLRRRGLLNDTDTVVDVGCGPGLFVAEFAKYVKRSVGIDYSQRFTDYGAELAASRGLANAEFFREDFFALDVEERGLAGAFDLVFTSITPAASGEGCLEKLIKMSRGYCYNASFVHAGDSLAERVSRDVFNEKYANRFDGEGFYALLNLLWFQGFYPETYYYDDSRVETIAPTRKAAAKVASSCGRDSEEDTQKVLKYLERLGETERVSNFRYGSVLWNTRVRDKR
ncbi:MAG: class I SAM-dependent methyltransferase [Oscillospiraceae bacterium]|jgi:SAM-dependent methyltransferase|nr:class I SAM-dependent methyltransferase [Oscillospiraceae bacterium]